MEKTAIYRCQLQELTASELEMRGGIAWDKVIKAYEVVKNVINFIFDYKDDMMNGFKKGWRML